MIDSIDLLHLRNDEHLQLNKDVAILTLQNDPVALKIKAQYDALVLKNEELDGLYKKQSASELTKELDAIDDRRDRAINGLITVADGYQNHFTAAKSQAGTRLSANFKLYGTGIARQNFQSETNILTSIVKDLEEKPELAAALITLQLIDWKDEIKAANSLYGTTYLKRTVEYSEVSKETLAAKREETNQVYYKLCKHIEANVTLNERQRRLYKTHRSNQCFDQTVQPRARKKKEKRGRNTGDTAKHLIEKIPIDSGFFFSVRP